MNLQRFATLVVLAVLAMPGGADAAAKRATATPVAVAAAVGTAFWAAVPCGGRVSYRTRQAVPAGLTAESDAWVTFDTPLGANNLAAAPSTYTNCRVSFGRARWPDTSSLREDWDMFCLTMVHELGHLLGKSHDLTRGSVMVPVFTDYSSEPASCRAARPRRSAAA